MKEISIWNKDGDRLFYSDKEDDLKTAKNLLTVIKAKTDKELASDIVNKEPSPPTYEQRMFGYFNACWKNKIVQLQKRASGYDW